MESRTAVWLGCVGGMLVIGLLFAIGYKRLYERQANRVLNGGSLRWRLPEFRHVIIGGIVVIAFLSVVLFAAQRPSELACEGSGDGGQAVIDTEMDHMREQIEAYHEEQSGNIVIREQREDPYFDLVVLQNDQNDEYLMLIIGKADFPVNDDHYYRFSFVNNVQETIDSYLDGQPDTAWIKWKGNQPVLTADAQAFVSFADGVLEEGKTPVPCLWQSAAAMVQYLLGNHEDAARRADAATYMKGSRRMRDNARCIRLLVRASTAPLGGETSGWLTDEMRWLDRKIKAERGNSPEYGNHYTDVKERIAYRVLARRYHAAGLHNVENALYGMMEENEFEFLSSQNDCDAHISVAEDYAWNNNYSAWNEYFQELAGMPADSLAAYYAYLTSAKTDVLEHYVAQQVYADKDYYNDLIGTRYLAEGRFADALEYLERVDTDYLQKQNISWYMANRDYTVPRWFVRQLPNMPETDGAGKGVPAENMKVKYCKDMIQLQSLYNLSPAGEQKDMRTYELAVRYYQASCYGDCWFLTHYGHSVNDSARAGEFDFARKARGLLEVCRLSGNMKIQYEALYALAYTDTEPWYAVSYDENYDLIITLLPVSSQYKALEALAKFAKDHPEEVDEHTTKCDVLKEFERRTDTHPSPPEGRELG